MPSSEQLLQALGRLGVVRAGELASNLGVSQPTLSRLIKTAGDRVCRIGRARATRYARTRTLPGLGRQLPLYRVTEGGKSEGYGALTLLDGGQHLLEVESQGTLLEGLPPFAVDMSPQGYIGRTFSARYPELDLPPRIVDW